MALALDLDLDHGTAFHALVLAENPYREELRARVRRWSAFNTNAWIVHYPTENPDVKLALDDGCASTITTRRVEPLYPDDPLWRCPRCRTSYGNNNERLVACFERLTYPLTPWCHGMTLCHSREAFM